MAAIQQYACCLIDRFIQRVCCPQTANNNTFCLITQPTLLSNILEIIYLLEICQIRVYKWVQTSAYQTGFVRLG